MIWELRNDLIGQVAVLVETDMQAIHSPFLTDGREKHWDEPPEVMPFVEKRKTQQKPRADVSHLCPGALVLNQRAYEALHEILGQHGQLLPILCAGNTEYFYNVTNIMPGIDLQQSEVENGLLKKEMFPSHFLSAAQPMIFKDPLTLRTRMYANDEAKTLLQEKIRSFNITGLKFSEPGTVPY